MFPMGAVKPWWVVLCKKPLPVPKAAEWQCMLPDMKMRFRTRLMKVGTMVINGRGGLVPLASPPPPSVTCHRLQVQVQGRVGQGTTQTTIKQDEALLSELSVSLELSMEMSLLL